MATNFRIEDQRSLKSSRDRIKAKQLAKASAGNVKSGASLIKNQVLGVFAGLKDLDGIQIFFIGVAGLKDFVDLIAGILSGTSSFLFDWIIDIPVLIFFIFIAVMLVLSNRSSTKTIILGLFGPLGVGIVELSPLGILPAYLGFAVWLVTQINNSKKKKKDERAGPFIGKIEEDETKLAA